MTESRCFFFGCWNSPGHYLFTPGGGPVYSRDLGYLVTHYGNFDHIDGTLAPLVMHDGSVTCGAWGEDANARARIVARGHEAVQGKYLVHQLDNGFTAMQWWDRCQGDDRGACNSTILLEGKHEAPALIDALEKNFPHVVANLKKHGVALSPMLMHAAVPKVSS